LLFIAVTWGIIFVIQEAVFRFVFPVPEVRFNRADYMPKQFSSDVTGKPLCNVITRWEFEPDGVSFNHTLNLYGFRGPDFRIAPPAGRERILFIGDSIVEGCGVADADTLPQQFARLLTDEPRPEVINLGVAAANFPEYMRLLHDAVPLLKPREVFLIVFMNDLPSPRFDWPTPPPGGLASLRLATFPRLCPLVPRALQAALLLREAGSLPRRVHSGPFPFFHPVPAPSNPLTSRPPVEGLDPELERAMKAGKANPYLPGTLPVFESRLRIPYDQAGGVANRLRFMNWFCHEFGASLSVVYVPFHVAANPLYIAAQVKLGGCEGIDLPASFSDVAHRAQQRHLARACRNAEIPFVDTTDAFIAAEEKQRLFWPTDGHCNPAGYHLIAESCVRLRAETHAHEMRSLPATSKSP
jgi:lysophospholipase L1-like esterase